MTFRNMLRPLSLIVSRHPSNARSLHKKIMFFNNLVIPLFLIVTVCWHERDLQLEFDMVSGIQRSFTLPGARITLAYKETTYKKPRCGTDSGNRTHTSCLEDRQSSR